MDIRADKRAELADNLKLADELVKSVYKPTKSADKPTKSADNSVGS